MRRVGLAPALIFKIKQKTTQQEVGRMAHTVGKREKHPGGANQKNVLLLSPESV